MKKILLSLYFFHSMSMGADCGSYLLQGKYLKYLNCYGQQRDLINDQMRGTALSFLGKDREAQLLFDESELADKKEMVPAETSTPDYSAFSRVDAITALEQASVGRRVVMLNEAHHIAQHRVFAWTLASMLRKQGFTHLAVETLNSEVSPLPNGYATLSEPIAGFYTAEPQFANFLRAAVLLGFKLVPYEAKESDIDARERAQAQNLARLLAAEPDAKIFVYAGYAHIKKKPSTNGRRLMASYFREFSGIDPLTVDQVGGTPSPYDQVSDSVWRGVRHRLASRPAVFKAAANAGVSDWLVSENYSGSVDVTVFHPQYKLIRGRPEWLIEGKTAHSVASKLVGVQRPVAIRAVLVHEKDGVPVDQVLLEDDASKAELYLPKGIYRIERETLERGVQTLYEVTVSAD